MYRKALAFFVSIVLILMSVPFLVSAEDSFVYLNGIELVDGAYWKNGDTDVLSGTADDYNAYFDLETSTLILKDAEITSGYYDEANDIFAAVYADIDNFSIQIVGDNTVSLNDIPYSSVYGVYSNQSLTVKDGSLDVAIKSDKTDNDIIGIVSGIDFTIIGAQLSVEVTSENCDPTGIYVAENMISFDGAEVEVASDCTGIFAGNANIFDSEYNIIAEEGGLYTSANLMLNDAELNVKIIANGNETWGVMVEQGLELSFGAVLHAWLENGADYESENFYAVSSLADAEWKYGGTVLPIGGKEEVFDDYLKAIVTPDGNVATEVRLTAELCNAAIQTDPTVVELDDAIEPVEIIVKNVGNVELELLQPESEFYKVSELTKVKLAPGETSSFTVTTLEEADSFEYIEIKTNYGTSTRLQVSYTIFDDHDFDHTEDEFENTEIPTEEETEIVDFGDDLKITDDCQDDFEYVVKTGVRHNLVLPIVLICVGLIVIVLLFVTRKKSGK